jgi:hypothetical protein
MEWLRQVVNRCEIASIRIDLRHWGVPNVTEPKKKRRGRPVKALGDRPRGPLSVRLRDQVRTELTISAGRHGRSLSEEIEAQLEANLAVQQYLVADWGQDVFWIARSLAASISQIERLYGCTWYEDERCTEIVRHTAAETISNYKAFFSNDNDTWLSIGAKGAKDPRDASNPQEAAVIFAARDLVALPRMKAQEVPEA